MTDYRDPLETIALLAAEGVRRFGDDPRAVAVFIETEIESLPIDERTELRRGLALVTAPVAHCQPRG